MTLGATTQRRQSNVLLRNRNFAYLIGGQWLSEIGSTFFSLAVFWYVFNTTHSLSDLGLVGGVLSIPAVLGLVSGVFVDRFDRKRIMITADVARALISFGIALLAYMGDLPLLSLLALLFLLEVSSNFFQPASMALIPKLVESSDLAKANGVYRASFSSAAFLGATVGGAIMATLGPIILFFTNGVSFVLSVLSLGLINVSDVGIVRRGDSFWTDWKEGLNHLWSDRFTRFVTFSAVFVNLAMQAVMVLLAAWVKVDLHGTALDYGLIEAGYIIGLICGSLSASTVVKRLGMSRTMIVGLVITGLLTVTLSRVSNFYWAMVPFALIAFSSAVRNTASNTKLQKRTPSALHGRVFGTLFSLSTLASPLGAAGAGTAAAALSLPTVYLIAGLLVIISTVPLVSFWRDPETVITAGA